MKSEIPGPARAAGLGAVSGLRTMQALAWLARDLSGRRPPRGASRIERWLARRDVAAALTLAASGELMLDKLPGVPDRVALPPLIGRALAGAVVGSVVVGRGRRGLGAAIGAGAAVAAAFSGWWLRREIGRATVVPGAVLAVAEDALAVGVARRLTARP